MPHIPTADGLDIHCFVDNFARPWETRTPVLMMHAYARNGLFWDPWVPLIANRRAVYRPEIPGCGPRSTVPSTDYVFDVYRLLDSVIAVLDHFSLERVHWIGDASGGMLGVLMALRHPQRLRSLVMLNSSGGHSTSTLASRSYESTSKVDTRVRPSLRSVRTATFDPSGDTAPWWACRP